MSSVAAKVYTMFKSCFARPGVVIGRAARRKNMRGGFRRWGNAPRNARGFGAGGGDAGGAQMRSASKRRRGRAQGSQSDPPGKGRRLRNQRRGICRKGEHAQADLRRAGTPEQVRPGRYTRRGRLRAAKLRRGSGARAPSTRHAVFSSTSPPMPEKRCRCRRLW